MPADLRVYVFGAGKVGTALARALRGTGARVTLRAARDGLPSKPIDANLLVLAVRDGKLGEVVERLVSGKGVTRRTVVVHCAGALGVGPLEPLRGICKGVAQMHPMISFASTKFTPSLERGQVGVDGDGAAVRVATRVARRLGMTPRHMPEVDKIAYHAAAGFVANGAAALAGAGTKLFARGGVDRSVAAKMLGPLLRSVADNVERLGLPDALTGPVRRGDPVGIERHLQVITERTPELTSLYRELVAAQVPLARQIGDADPSVFDAIERLMAPGGAPPAPIGTIADKKLG